MSRLPWTRPVLITVGLVIAYFAFPEEPNWTWLFAVNCVLTAGALVLIAWTMVVELRHFRQGQLTRSPQTLAMLLVLLVMAFSASFYLLERGSPGQVVDLSTRTDALYFTLATMATVGYGDVHAEGQAARLLVCLVIAFDVVVVASLVRASTMRHEESRRGG